MFSSNAGSDGSCHSGAMQIECFVMDLFILSDIGGFKLGKGSTEKNVFFRALPELPKPPPPLTPIRAT